MSSVQESRGFLLHCWTDTSLLRSGWFFIFKGSNQFHFPFEKGIKTSAGPRSRLLTLATNRDVALPKQIHKHMHGKKSADLKPTRFPTRCSYSPVETLKPNRCKEPQVGQTPTFYSLLDWGMSDSLGRIKVSPDTVSSLCSAKPVNPCRVPHRPPHMTPNITDPEQPALLPCQPFLDKTASPRLICLCPGFGDPCFTLFRGMSVCLSSHKSLCGGVLCEVNP